MVDTDSREGWGLLSRPGESAAGSGREAGSRGNIRVVEYHEYNVGGEVSDPTHTDAGSLVTMRCVGSHF